MCRKIKRRKNIQDFSCFQALKVVLQIQKYFEKGIAQSHNRNLTQDQNRFATTFALKTTMSSDTLQHNPFVNLINSTFTDSVHPILEKSSLSLNNWPFAGKGVIFVQNQILPLSRGGCTPLGKLTNTRFLIKNADMFGSPSFIYNHISSSEVYRRAVLPLFVGENCNDFKTVKSILEIIVFLLHATFDKSSFFLALENSLSFGEN